MINMGRVSTRPVSLSLGVIIVCAAVGLWLAPGFKGRSAARSGAAGAAAAGGPAAGPWVVAGLPPTPAGFAIPPAQDLGRAADETRWAPVIHPAAARSDPSFASPIVNGLPSRTPEGTTNLVVARRELTRGGVEWVDVSLPSLRARGREGWVPRSVLGGWSFVDTRVIVDRRRLTLTLIEGGRVVFRAPVGVGTPANPTPAGTFYVRDRVSGFTSPMYGPLAFGTSARAPHLTDWPNGGYIGIHGTDQPQLIPGRISHGCIRLRNSAILTLGRLMSVGTPVIVR